MVLGSLGCPVITHAWVVYTCVYMCQLVNVSPCFRPSYLVGAEYEYNNETWVWKMSGNAVSLTHIPLSPPTDWLSFSPPFPAFVLVITTPLFSSFLSFLSHHLLLIFFPLLPCFFSPCLWCHVYAFPSIHKESLSLIFFIPLLLLRILLSSAWYSLMPPPVCLCNCKLTENGWQLLQPVLFSTSFSLTSLFHFNMFILNLAAIGYGDTLLCPLLYSLMCSLPPLSFWLHRQPLKSTIHPISSQIGFVTRAKYLRAPFSFPHPDGKHCQTLVWPLTAKKKEKFSTFYLLCVYM